MSTAGGEIRPFRLFIVSFGKPVFIHDRQLAVNLPPVPDWHDPFFRSFKGGQIQGLQKSLGTGENASLTVQLAVCGVQTLDRVRRVDDSSHIFGKQETLKEFLIPFLQKNFHTLTDNWLDNERLPASYSPADWETIILPSA